MKLKITRGSLLTMTYSALIVNVILGMIFKFASLSILRKLVIISKVLVLATIIFSGLVDLISFSKFRFKILLDGILLIFFVIYEMYISKIRGLLIFPDAYLDILIWPLIYLLFRNFTERCDIPQEFGKLTEISMAFVLLLSIPLIIKHRAGLGDVGGVVFYVYYCVTFLPMALYAIENDKRKHRLLLLTILMLALSTKRSGTIVAVIGYAIYLFTNVSVRKDIKNKLIKYWKYILFSKSKGDLKMFGHGFQAVYYRLKPYGVDRLAHNSFIEFLYDYGYVGLGIFFGFLATQLIGAIKAIQHKNLHAPEMLYSLLVAVVFGLSSYFFEESTIIVPIAAFWGCFAGTNSRSACKKVLR